MLSICSSIYRETQSLEIFVRSVLGNASDPSQVEIVIVNDEGYPPTTDTLKVLSEEFSQLKYLTITRPERIEFIHKTIVFYKENQIFPTEDIVELEKTLEKYKTGELDKLWFQAAHNYNLAVAQSQGDVLAVLPSDYFCFFDATEIYQRCLELKSRIGSFVGHFDWIDTTSLDPMPDICGILRKLKAREEIREFTLRCLDDAIAQRLTSLPEQHGSRVVDRGTFDKVGGFDGRWFVRAFGDDLFNCKVKKILPPPYRLADHLEFTGTICTVGVVRPGDWGEPAYLHPRYFGSPEYHRSWVDKIEKFLGEKVW